MARENITHVLSVLRLNTTDETTFAPYRHHFIDVDDVDDENLLEHFPAAIKFIQAGLDTGGGVLVHWLVHLFLSCLATTCLKPLGLFYLLFFACPRSCAPCGFMPPTSFRAYKVRSARGWSPLFVYFFGGD